MSIIHAPARTHRHRHPSVREICREVIRRVEDGDNRTAISADLRARGVPDPWGNGWTLASIRLALGKPTLSDLGVAAKSRNPTPVPAERVAELARARQPIQRSDRDAGSPVAPLVDQFVVDMLWDWPCLPTIGRSAWCVLCRTGHAVHGLGIARWSSRNGGPCHHADAPPLVTLLAPDEWEWGLMFRDDTGPANTVPANPVHADDHAATSTTREQG